MSSHKLLVELLKKSPLVRDVEYDSDENRIVFHLNCSEDDADLCFPITNKFEEFVNYLGFEAQFNDCEGYYNEGEIRLDNEE